MINMGDLWMFQGTLTGVAGVITLDTERINAAVAGVIQLDQGMVAKIWELQLEGNGIANIMIQYSKDGAVWEDLKGFSKPVATVPERLEKFNRPIIAAEAWNNTTWLRFMEVAGSAAGIEFSVNIEFDEIERQP